MLFLAETRAGSIRCPADCGLLCYSTQVNVTLADNSFISSDMSLRTCLKILKSLTVSLLFW